MQDALSCRLEWMILDRIDRPEDEEKGCCNYTSTLEIAARQSASALYDSRQNKLYDYTHSPKRPFFTYSKVYLPPMAPAWAYDRSRLWNAVEAMDEDVNAQLNLDVKIWLPINLTVGEYRSLLTCFIEQEFLSRGMVVDINLHTDKPAEPHTHALIPLFEINENGFTKRNDQWKNPNLLMSWKANWKKQVQCFQEKKLELAK